MYCINYYIHIERTASEFMLGAYGSGGASTNIPGVPFANKCPDCHTAQCSLQARTWRLSRSRWLLT